jgi:nucleoside-diphosphate-sugar epimerase
LIAYKETKILITGTNGFLGKNILNYIKKKEYKIFSIVRKKKLNYPKNFLTVESDIGNLNIHTLDKIKKFKPTIVLNLAWNGIPDYSYENCFKNIKEQISFFNNIKKIKSIKKIICIGSCWEYPEKIGKCKVKNKLNMESYFSWSKQTIYNFIKLITKKNKIDLVWFRIFFMYGRYQKNSSLIPLIILSLKNKKFPKINNPQNRNDFIFVDDVCEAIMFAIKKKNINGIFNLGSGNTFSVQIILKKIIKNLNINVKNKKFIAKKNKKTKYNYSDNKNTFNKLRWIAKTNIDQGIKKMIEFYYE